MAQLLDMALDPPDGASERDALGKKRAFLEGKRAPSKKVGGKMSKSAWNSYFEAKNPSPAPILRRWRPTS